MTIHQIDVRVMKVVISRIQVRHQAGCGGLILLLITNQQDTSNDKGNSDDFLRETGNADFLSP